VHKIAVNDPRRQTSHYFDYDKWTQQKSTQKSQASKAPQTQTQIKTQAQAQAKAQTQKETHSELPRAPKRAKADFTFATWG
jgi:hypothetical protein